MSESAEMTENSEKESQENVSSSTVAAQYELFNKELGLDETTESKKEEAKESGKDDVTEEATGKETAETEEKKDETSKAPAEESADKVEEPEEPDSDDEVIEDDVDDWEGDDDPNEAEVERFTLPAEQIVMSDLTDQSRKRRVVIYPIKLGELGHPSVVEVIKNCIDFKTTFVQCKMNESSDEFAFHGIIEFNCKSTVGAVEALESLKTVREDVKARIMDPGETAKKLMQTWNTDSAAAPQALVQNLLIVKPLAKDVTVEQLRDLFPDACDIMTAHPKFFPRLAYVSYDDSKAVDEIVSRYSADRPVIGECRLKVLKYQPPNLPGGFLRMKRRYRILLQVKKLGRALKDKKASYSENQRKKMKSTIEHCTSLIEKDDAARTEIGLKMLTLKELRRIRKIRESVKPETIWLPRQPGDKREDHSRVYLGEDDDKESSHEKRSFSKFSGKRYDRFQNRSPPPHGKWHDSRGGPGGVPSLMSMPMDGPIEPIARVHAITQQLAQMASMFNPPMRGGPGGMNRGRGSFRGGRFGPGRGGFHGGDMDGEFGPPPSGGFGPRRGGGFGSGGGGNFNKRPRQDSSGDRDLRDIPDVAANEEPRNRSEDGREPAGKMLRQDSESGWSSDNTKAIQSPSQQKNQSFSSGSNRGRQSGWSKPPSKFNQGGGSASSGFSSSGGFNKSSYNQGGFKRGGGPNQGGYNQGSGSGYNQGSGGGFSGTGYNQGGGSYNQGGSGGYNQGSGGYNQGGTGGFNQGSGSSYNQGGAGGYNQGSSQSQGSAGFNQGTGTYNQGGTGGAGYNQSAATYNQGSGYNQPAGGSYQQGSSSSSYGNQGTGYNYNYPSQTGTGTGTGTGAYQASQTPAAQPVAAQQTWGTSGAAQTGQQYWQQPQQQQQPSQGTWQPAAQPTGQAQSTDQGSYSYGWNTWK